MGRNETIYDFSKFRKTRVDNYGKVQGFSLKANKKSLDNICDHLKGYYPLVEDMNTGKRIDFVLFLFEKALKEKSPSFITTIEKYGKKIESTEARGIEDIF